MFVQLLTILLALMGLIIFNKYNKNKVTPYVNYVILILILQSALRDYSVGADTENYIRQYKEIFSTPWHEIFQNFVDVYKLGEGKDAGFPLLMKFLSVFNVSPRLYLFIIAAIFFIPLGYLMKTYLKDVFEVFISFCFYQALFYSFFSITGIRQTIATAFAFISLICLQKKKTVLFVIFILLGSFIHKSLLIFLVAFFIYDIFKRAKLGLIVSYCLFPVVMVFGRVISSFMATVAASDIYEIYSDSGYNAQGALMFAAGLIVCSILVLYNFKKIANERYANFLINCLSLSIVFTPLAWVDPSLMRITQYFSIFTIFLVPFVYRTFGKHRNIFLVLFCILCIFTVIRHNYVYIIGNF